jgi:hypothetical protein
VTDTVVRLNRPATGELIITNLPKHTGTYLALTFGHDTYPVARFTNEAGLDMFRRWVAGNKGRTMGGYRDERS